MDPLRKLASAVILSALSDAQNGCPEARRWLLQDNFAFPVWCAASGLDPTRARRKVKSVLAEAPLTKKRRRELIIQALTKHPELSNRAIGRRLKVNYESVRQLRKRMPQALAR